jgi:hypothetical protein
MTTTILALDLGTTTGWALRGSDGHITSGTESFRPQRFEGGGMRFLRFKRWLTEIKQSSDGIDCGALRGGAAPRLDVDAAHAYGGFLATLTAWCEHHQIPYQGVPVGTIKKHATGKGNAGKDEMIVRPCHVVTIRSTTTKPMPWHCCTGPSRRRRCDVKIPAQQYRCPSRSPATADHRSGRIKQPAGATSTSSWCPTQDERLDFVEREFVRRIGERLYGGKRHG